MKVKNKLKLKQGEKILEEARSLTKGDKYYRLGQAIFNKLPKALADEVTGTDLDFFHWANDQMVVDTFFREIVNLTDKNTESLLKGVLLENPTYRVDCMYSFWGEEDRKWSESFESIWDALDYINSEEVDYDTTPYLFRVNGDKEASINYSMIRSLERRQIKQDEIALEKP